MAINENYKNLGGLVQEVIQFGFGTGPQVNRNRIEAWLNEAQFQIAREVDAPEFMKSETLQLTQGVFEYPLPASFLRMLDIFYPEMLVTLNPMDIKKFDTLGRGQYEGAPSAYTLFANTLWLWPNPINSTDTLELRYIEDPPQLVNEADVPVLNGNYWHLLIEYAVARAFEAEDDLESAQAHKTEYTKNLAAYATDVQWRIDDRPRIVDGTWPGASYGLVR
jgi:hypothetical protein